MTKDPQFMDRSALVAECETLREENRQLRALAFGTDAVAPPEWGLTPQETRLVALLAAGRIVTKDSFLAAEEHHRGADLDLGPKAFEAVLCHVRRKLGPFGVWVVAMRGEGWRLEPHVAAAVREALSGGPARVGSPVERPGRYGVRRAAA